MATEGAAFTFGAFPAEPHADATCAEATKKKGPVFSFGAPPAGPCVCSTAETTPEEGPVFWFRSLPAQPPPSSTDPKKSMQEKEKTVEGEIPDDTVAPWSSLPDELCKYIAQQYFMTQCFDVVPLLRLICRDWKEAIDRSLESLHLAGRKTLRLKTQMPHVKEVTVFNSSDPNLLANLGQLPGLQLLVLDTVECPASAFSELALLGGLQELKIINEDDFPADKAEHLTALTSLTSCSFEYCSAIDPSTFQVLAQLPRLQSLTLKACPSVTGAHLSPLLTGSAPLAQLHLVGWCDVSQEVVQKLAAMPTMKDVQKYRLKPCSI